MHRSVPRGFKIALQRSMACRQTAQPLQKKAQLCNEGMLNGETLCAFSVHYRVHHRS